MVQLVTRSGAVSSLALLVAGLLGTANTLAQEAPRGGALELKTVVEKLVEVEDVSGSTRTELVSADIAVPGDKVVYTVTFTNVGDAPAENVLITNPIPQEMRYADGSAFGPGAEIEYSIDGGQNYADPQGLLVAEASGRERLASADDYTHIRWQLTDPLPPGAQGMARFRATVR